MYQRRSNGIQSTSQSKVQAIINGKLLNEITECTISSGFIGIQSEGGDIEIRSVDYLPLKDSR